MAFAKHKLEHRERPIRIALDRSGTRANPGGPHSKVESLGMWVRFDRQDGRPLRSGKYKSVFEEHSADAATHSAGPDPEVFDLPPSGSGSKGTEPCDPAMLFSHNHAHRGQGLWPEAKFRRPLRYPRLRVVPVPLGFMRDLGELGQIACSCVS